LTEIYQRRNAGWAGWGWIAIGLIVLGIFLIVFLFWPGSGGTAYRIAQQNSVADGRQPITSIEQIVTAEDPAALRGRAFVLDGATVENMGGGKTFWLGNNENERVLAVLTLSPYAEQPVEPARYSVRPGVLMDASGTVGTFPGRERALLNWGAEPATIQEAENRRIFLRVERVFVKP
jgi:hypothetical protein